MEHASVLRDSQALTAMKKYVLSIVSAHTARRNVPVMQVTLFFVIQQLDRAVALLASLALGATPGVRCLTMGTTVK